MESFLGKEKYSPNRRIAFPCFFTNVSILICVKKSLGKLEKDIPCGAFTQEKQDMQADRRREYKYRKRFAGDKIP